MADRELDHWQGRPVEAWREAWGVPALRIFERVESTNDVAALLAHQGADKGTLVLADAQTRGRGRRDRTWVAPPGTSLSMSMVLRPGPDQVRLLTLRLGLAAADALETVGDVRIGLKWPNDLMVEGRKLGGILCEGDTARDGADHVVAGMGINLMAPADGWPPPLRGRAISLHAAGIEVGAAELVGRLVDGWRRAGALAGPLSPAEREAFRRRDVLRGHRVRVEGRPLGTAAGIGADGALRVETGAGIRTVVAGTVRTEQLQGQDL